jgi:hypothetical protein
MASARNRILISEDIRMRNRFKAAVIGFLATILAAWCTPASAQTASAPASSGVVVLDTSGAWRIYHVMRSPMTLTDGNLLLIPSYEGRAKLDWYDGYRKGYRDILAPQTPAAPQDWRTPDFDDSEWVRGTAARACRTPYLERLCLRGKFDVSDPAKVGKLTLDVDFHGGAVVYVNGKEVARANMPAAGRTWPIVGEANAPQATAELAEEYPLEAFVGEDCKLLSARGDEALWKTKPSAEDRKRIEGRERKLSIVIPATALRQGLNVLAVELLRSPYHKVVGEQLVINENHNPGPAQAKTPDLSWNTCEIRRVQLVAAAKDGLASQAARPEGFEIWNSNAMQTDYDLDQGEPGPLRPIRLVGARNGAYSCKVVLGSDKPIVGLSATVGELKSPAPQGSAVVNAAIPASAVQVRYGMPWGNIILTNPGNNEAIPYAASPAPMLAMFEAPPKEVPVYKKAAGASGFLKTPGQPAPVFGAVVPIWVTVRVPKDARPGDYTGQVTIAAEGLKPTAVAVSVKVLEWTVPDPSERRTWVELIQSPDTLALEYNVPLWGEKHCELVARSMRYVREMGSRTLYVPLIAQSNAGNNESMVRWIRKPDGTYDYDFSIMDKYLDLAQKHLDAPKVVEFNVWDLYMGGIGTRFRMPAGSQPPHVTQLDPATGKTQEITLLPLSDANGMALWKPLFVQLRARMVKRGWEKAMMLGMVTDNWADKVQVEFLKEASGNLPWVNAGHYTQNTFHNGLADFGYQASFFGYRENYLGFQYGWKEPKLVTLFERVPLDYFAISRWRGIGEQAIFGNMRGVGRLGADTWRAVWDKARANRTARAWERWPGSNWGYLNCDSSTLAPSPEGAVATMRYEALREGLQECEARIAIEQATSDETLKKKLGVELVRKCEDLMRDRQRCFFRSMTSMQSGPLAHHDMLNWRDSTITGYIWLIGSGWQERSEKLYSLADEVARKLESR